MVQQLRGTHTLPSYLIFLCVAGVLGAWDLKRDCGAKTGNVSDYGAFMTCLDRVAAAGGGQIHVPFDRLGYNITAPLNISSQVAITGEKVRLFGGNAGGNLFNVRSSGVTIDNFVLDMHGSPQGSAAIFIHTAELPDGQAYREITLRRLRIEGSYSALADSCYHCALPAGTEAFSRVIISLLVEHVLAIYNRGPSVHLGDARAFIKFRDVNIDNTRAPNMQPPVTVPYTRNP